MPHFDNFDPDSYPIRLTNADICIPTTNPLCGKVMSAALPEERKQIQDLRQRINEQEERMDITYKSDGHYQADDQQSLIQMQIKHDRLLEELQQKYLVTTPTSRTQAVLTPTDGFGRVPFGFSNMVRVTGKRMGEASARRGGWAVFPQGKSEAKTQEFIVYVQTRSTRFLTPVSGTPDTTIRDALYYLQKRPVGHVVVTDGRGKILRILAEARIKEYEKLDEELELGQIPLSREEQRVVRGFDDMTMEEASSLMRSEHIHFLPIVNRVRGSRQKLQWVLTRKEAEIQQEFPAHLDAEGRLATVVAVSMFREGWDKRVRMLIDSNVTAIVLDSPHAYQGHGKVVLPGEDAQEQERKALRSEGYRPRVKWVAEQIVASQKPVRLIVGNVDDPKAVNSIVAAAVEGGVDPNMVTVKVGIGPGHACITREEAGTGMPQWSTVYECAKAARRMGANVQADGGVALPADVEKYIAAGASHVMIGTKGVSLVESAAVLKQDEHGIYGVNYGMGSDVAYSLRDDVPHDGSAPRFNEGLREQRVYQTSGVADVTDFTARYGRGLKSFILFNGATTPEEAYENVHVALQNPSGFIEGLGKRVVQ